MVAAIAGCSSSVPIRSHGARVGGQGAEPALVFTTSEVRSVVGDFVGDEYARLDWRLHATEPESAFNQLAFPHPAVPTLDRSRRVWLGSTTPDLYLYFQRTRPYEQERYWRSWTWR